MEKLLEEYDIDFEIPNPTQSYNRGGHINYSSTQRIPKYWSHMYKISRIQWSIFIWLFDLFIIE